MQHGTHVIVVGLDVAHRGLDIRVVEQALREVNVPLGCLHQVGGQGVPETVRVIRTPTFSVNFRYMASTWSEFITLLL